MCFRRLWARCEIVQATKTIARLGVLNDCIMKSGGVNAGNHSEQRITEDFYLNVFCPKAHFTLEDVLYELPRLCNSNELVPSCLLDKLPSSFIPSKSASSPSLSSVQLGTGATTSKKPSKAGPPTNVQKKMTPWTAMLGELDLEGRAGSTRPRPHPGLLLVASLIDKVPNLGGLARTCEVLGVGGMVVANANVTKEKDFTAVSVTAEKWLPILECPEDQLPQLLAERRR